MGARKSGRLSEKEIESMRAEWDRGATAAELAARYRCTRSTVWLRTTPRSKSLRIQVDELQRRVERLEAALEAVGVEGVA